MSKTPDARLESDEVAERPRREPAGPGVPSQVSRARLAGEVRREVADLRVRLSEASLRSTALEEAGLPGAAAEVAAEQRELLDGFRRRLDAAVAAAVVEREAELVLAAELARAVRETEPRRLPAALSAALAVAAVIALAVGSGESYGVAPATSGDPVGPPQSRQPLEGGAAPDPVESADAGTAGASPRGAGATVGAEASEGMSVAEPIAPPDDGLPDLVRTIELELQRGLAAVVETPAGVAELAGGDDGAALAPTDDGGPTATDEEDAAPDGQDAPAGTEPEPSGGDGVTTEDATEDTAAQDPAPSDGVAEPAPAAEPVPDDGIEPGLAEPQTRHQELG